MIQWIKDARSTRRLTQRQVAENVPMENVVLMADIYNSPELMNQFCCNECPIGRERSQELDLKSLELITVQVVSYLRGIDRTKDTLLDITQDGCISEDELPDLDHVLESLDTIAKLGAELRLWAEKHLQNRRKTACGNRRSLGYAPFDPWT